MAYPADAFGGGVQGVWYDAGTIANFERDNVTLADFNGSTGRFFDEWNDKSGNGNDLTSALVDWDGRALTDGSYQKAWFWHPLAHSQGGSTTGMYLAIAHQEDAGTPYYTTLWTDQSSSTTGFKLEYNGDGGGLPANSAYIFSAGTGSTRINAVISSGDPLFSFENGKKLIECWWTSALGLNIRINKGPVTTVLCPTVSAGSSTAQLPGLDWIGYVHNFLYTKNTALDSTARNAIADSFGSSAGITLATTAFPIITGDMHARELAVDDRAVGIGANSRNGYGAITEGGRDSFAGRSALFIGGRQGVGVITESGSDIVGGFRLVPDTIDEDFMDWMESDDKIFTILVEADVNVMASPGGGETTRYLSNTGYNSRSSDTPASTHYVAVITAGGTTTEVMPIDGNASMAFGDIEIDNEDGTLDAWLDDIWTGRRCRVYVGDQRWAKSSFRLVFDGISNENLTSRARNVLNLPMRDKLQKLNTSVSETKLGGISANADRLLPITLGEVHNVAPLLINRSTLEYQFHDSTGGWNNAERVIEVRDNGIPVPCTPANPGKFTLEFSPFGTVTASVQGDSQPYAMTAAPMIQRIAKNCSNSPLVDADLDVFNLGLFNAANPQALGLFMAEATNAYAVCTEVAASVGAHVVMTATGLLRMIKISLPVPGTVTPTAVGPTRIIEGTLEISSRPQVIAAVKIGYCRNWTPQPDLRTAIPAEHKDLFAQEWLTATAKSAQTAFDYKLSQEPEQINTLLITKADADAEALRRLNLWKVQRTIYRYQGTADLLQEQLGGYQTITNRRFGLTSGKTGQIISIQRDWMNGRVVIELLV